MKIKTIKKEKYGSFLLSILLLPIAMISIHTGSALAKMLFLFIEVESLTILRQVIGTTILLIIFKPWKNFTISNIDSSVIIYGLSLGAMNYLFYISLKKIPLSIAVALEFIGPLIIGIIFSRKIVDFIWLILAISGLIILLPLKININSTDIIGSICALGAGFFWGMYIIFGKKAGIQYGSKSVAIASCISTVVFCPIAIWQNKNFINFFDIIPAAFFIAILSTVIPYSLEIIALSKIPVRTFSILMSLEPVIAVILGIIFLQEKLYFMQWIALLLIFIASIGTSYTSRKLKNNCVF